MHLALFMSLVAAAPGEIVVWHSYRAGEAEVLERTVETWRAAHPGAVVRVLAVPAGAYSQKLRHSIPYGNGPDLFVMAHDELGDLVTRKLVEPLPAGVATERFFAETVGPLRRDGSLWALPLAFKSLVLFYRTDLVAAPPLTVEEMFARAAELRGDGRYGLVYQVGEPYFHAPWLFGYGGRILDDAGTRTLLDSPAAIASGELVARMTREGLVPMDVNGALVTELFNRGRAAMVVNGPWFVPEIAEGVPYAVAALPSVNGAPARPFLTVEALFVAAGRARPEVLALAEHLTGDEAAFARASQARQPVANAAIYARPEVQSDALLAAFAAQLRDSVPMPTAPLMLLVWEPMAEALRQISRGAVSPATALRGAQSRIAVLARGLPEATSPAPFVVGLLLVLAAALVWLVLRLRRGAWRAALAARGAYAFVAPAAVGMLVMVGVPFVMGMGLGFFELAPGETRFVGLANFTSILTARDYAPTEPMSFYFTLIVTVLWTALNVALHVGLGLGLALLLNESWLAGRNVFRVLLILPWAIPSYITALVFKGLFNKQLGAINALLGAAGIEPVGWFDSFWPAFAANLTTNVWLGFPFMMVTIMGALQAIPQDLYEAARVDGATSWRRFARVTLPLVAPALVPAVVLGTIWTFNMFNVVFLVSEGQPEGATDILVTEAYRWAFARNGRYGYAAAYSTIIFGILLVYGRWAKKITAALTE